LENAPILADAGYDYIELSVRRDLVPEEDERVFAEVRRQAERAPLPVRAFAEFLPENLKVTGPDVDMGRLSRYVDVALRRAREIGGKVVVWGSGPSRQVPDGFPHDRAMDQIVVFLDMVADYAEQHEIIIAIESLRKAETNILNLISETLPLAKRVNRPRVRLLADFYHIAEEGEDIAHVEEADGWIVHTHIAEPDGRKYPGHREVEYGLFFNALRQIGYEGRMSVECQYDDFAQDVHTALKTLRRYSDMKNSR
jgi:sugar phosphate isomerase/epimerase